MPETKMADLTFGEPEAENDRFFLERAFYETEGWGKVQSRLRLPFIVGRKGSGKSAIAIRTEIAHERAGQDTFIKLVPSDFRHVEIRELLKCLVNADAPWQYIYEKVWEGIILGQIVHHMTDETHRSTFYRKSRSLETRIDEFRNACPLYVNALQDSLTNVITEHVREVAGQKKEVELVQLRKILQPYDWRILLEALEGEHTNNEEHVPQLVVCVDGLDEHWDCSPPSLYFLAEALKVVKTFSARLPKSVRFMICLRDNIFRALVNTHCVEYDKLESAIVHLNWSSRSLLELIAVRAYVGRPPAEAVKQLRRLLPESIEGARIEDYLANHVLNRPRDYINYFLLLQAKCYNSELVGELHMIDATAQYSAQRLVDLENEFAFTYPGVTKVVGALSDTRPPTSKADFLERLKELCADDRFRRDVPELMLHYGNPVALAKILMSIGVLGVYDPRENAIKYIHEFSESRMAALFKESEYLALHPVYTFSGSRPSTGWRRVVESVENPHTGVAVLTHPTDYLPEKDDHSDLESVSDKTRQKRLSHLADLTGIKKGLEHSRRFEKWVAHTLELCFLRDLAHCSEQTPSHNGAMKFELIYDIVGDQPPWTEIKSTHQTHRLLVECKNTDVPTDADFSKLTRDMDALALGVSFIAYRSSSREPSGVVLRHQRSRYQNSHKMKIIIAITEQFLVQCLKKQTEKDCRDNLNKLWRSHLEMWLVT